MQSVIKVTIFLFIGPTGPILTLLDKPNLNKHNHKKNLPLFNFNANKKNMGGGVEFSSPRAKHRIVPLVLIYKTFTNSQQQKILDLQCEDDIRQNLDLRKMILILILCKIFYNLWLNACCASWTWIGSVILYIGVGTLEILKIVDN